MNAIRRFLMLLRIDLKRSQAGFAAVAAFGLRLVAMSQSEGPDQVVLWNEVNRKVADGHIFIGPIGAAAAVWAIGRSRRRGMEGQEAALPGPAGTSALITMVAVSVWMIAAQIAYFLCEATPAWRSATWGGPDYPRLLASVLAIVVCVAIGSVVARFGRSAIMAPVTLVALYGGKVYVSDSVYREKAYLVPVKFFSDLNWGLRYRVPVELTLWFCLWLGAASIVIAGIALLLRSRSTIRIATIAVAAMLAIVSANRVIAYGGWNLEPERVNAVPVCENASGIEVCLHPAYTVLMDDVVSAVAQVAPQFAGREGVPTTLYEQEAVPDEVANGGGPVLHLWSSAEIDRMVTNTFSEMLLSNPEFGGPHGLNASQCAIASALTSTLASPFCLDGIIVESQPNESQVGLWRLDQDEMNEWAARMQEKVDSFSALTPEAQRAWLDANWDVLRAGNLTLEELP